MSQSRLLMLLPLPLCPPCAPLSPALDKTRALTLASVAPNSYDMGTGPAENSYMLTKRPGGPTTRENGSHHLGARTPSGSGP